HPPDPRHEGDGHRAGERSADRRDDRPRCPSPGEHEAPRSLELVPPQLAALAAQARAPCRAEASAGTGRSLTTTRQPQTAIRAATCGPDLVCTRGDTSAPGVATGRASL